MNQQQQGLRLYQAIEKLCLQAGTDTDETVDWLCGSHSGMYKLFNSFFGPNPAQRKPLTHEQRVDLLAKFEPHKHEWHAPAILIDMVEAAHGIKGDA